jgi:hypothetical protein
MDEQQFEALRKALEAADEQERLARSNALSRRGFIRTVTFAAMTSSALLSQNAGAGFCNTNTAGCTGSVNTCSTNHCDGATANTCATSNVCDINTCLPSGGTGSGNSCTQKNECQTQNQCGPASSPNSCTALNQCDEPNTCNHANTCTTVNTCYSNTCGWPGWGNVCTAKDTKCEHGNNS